MVAVAVVGCGGGGGAKEAREEAGERVLEDGQAGADDAEVGFEEGPDAAVDEMVGWVLAVLGCVVH